MLFNVSQPDPGPQPRTRRVQTYDDPMMRGVAKECPWVTDMLRLFECSACCSDRNDLAELDHRAGMQHENLWESQEEEPIARMAHLGLRNAVADAALAQGGFPMSPRTSGNKLLDRHPSRKARGFHQGGTATRAMASAASGSDAGMAERRSDPFKDMPLEERATLEVEGGYSYTGQWRGPSRHGQGALERADGVRFVGSFYDNMAHGRGIFTGADRSRYEGEWERDHMHGYGKYVDFDGSTYEGEWSVDAKSGRGIECFSDGARYEGEFWQGGKHGAGIFRSGTGVEYEGQYAFDKMNGEGRYKFADGRFYCGQWSQGHMQGVGKMNWPNGSKYEGGYEQDKKHGDGTFLWPDGRSYVGQWRNGQLDGCGVLIKADGEEEQQEWINGQRVAEALRSDV